MECCGGSYCVRETRRVYRRLLRLSEHFRRRGNDPAIADYIALRTRLRFDAVLRRRVQAPRWNSVSGGGSSGGGGNADQHARAETLASAFMVNGRCQAPLRRVTAGLREGRRAVRRVARAAGGRRADLQWLAELSYGARGRRRHELLLRRGGGGNDGVSGGASEAQTQTQARKRGLQMFGAPADTLRYVDAEYVRALEQRMQHASRHTRHAYRTVAGFDRAYIELKRDGGSSGDDCDSAVLLTSPGMRAAGVQAALPAARRNPESGVVQRVAEGAPPRPPRPQPHTNSRP